MANSIETKRKQLLEAVSGYGSCAVAFSGGVDSAVVAKAAQLSLGETSLGKNAVAVTAVSASLASAELETAREVAKLIGIRHVELTTRELSNPSYAANAPDRCYHCKAELYSQLAAHIASLGMQVMANGANADDLQDYRPGHRASEEFRVESPLADCGINKQQVRELAHGWQLPVADKPASPCLASRLAYGQEVTAERLEMIERAEQELHQFGLQNVRVRYHADDLARLEVPAEAIAMLAEPAVRDHLAKAFKQLGFKFVTLDLEGFRSGSLNNLVPLEILEASSLQKNS